MFTRNRPIVLASAVFCALIAANPSRSQCLTWTSDFSRPGTDSAVHALCSFDDGHGPALYVAGEFTIAGGVPCSQIARWDGQRWSDVGGGIGRRNGDERVQALAVFDDGHGPALYAAGYFGAAGGVPAHSIAKWNGTSWSSVGELAPGAILHSLTVFDDENGSALYAGGSSNAHAVVLRWNGSTWSTAGASSGSGGSYTIESMLGFDDGSGLSLYVCGSFLAMNGTAAYGAARLQGTTWLPIATMGNQGVTSLAVLEDATGRHLYASGGFRDSNGKMHLLGRWNGTRWLPLGPELDEDHLISLTAFDDGSGPALYGFLDFGSDGKLVRWDGAQLTSSNSDVQGSQVSTLATFDDGTSRKLYLGGDFLRAGDAIVANIAAWDGVSWSTLGPPIGSGGPDSTVDALTTFDDGTGPALYAAGSNSLGASGAESRGVVRWNGSRWSGLGHGASSYPTAVLGFDDGSGPKLYASGSKVERWDGTSWADVGDSPVSNGPGTPATIGCMVAFDDGSGPALYAGGDLHTIPGDNGYSVGKWDGHSWTIPAGTLTGTVSSMAVFDDGTGAHLYASAYGFVDGGQPTSVARWNGTTWSPVGPEIGNDVRTLAVFDNGSGPSLYAGGRFLSAAGVPFDPTATVVRFDGKRWVRAGSTLTPEFNARVFALTELDDGTGAHLFAACTSWDEPFVLGVNRLRKLDGNAWTQVGGGLNSTIFALCAYDFGAGPDLYAGGMFTTAGRVVAQRVARLHGCR